MKTERKGHTVWHILHERTKSHRSISGSRVGAGAVGLGGGGEVGGGRRVSGGVA